MGKAKRKMINKQIILLFLFPILVIGQNDSLSDLDADWQEISGSIKYEKNLEPNETYRRGYIPPSLPEYHDGELETDDMIYDDVDREELYQKRLVMEREGAAGDAPVKKKIKDISKPKESVERDQFRIRPRNVEPRFDYNISFLKTLLLIIAIIILAFLIYQFVFKRIKLPEPKISDKFSDDVDLLNPEVHEEEELYQQLDRHLSNKEYRHALRVQYLMILKELIQKDLINWKNEKTNYHYQNELSSSPYFEDFHYVIYIFEKAWYGLYEVSKEDFDSVSPRINKLLTNLRNE